MNNDPVVIVGLARTPMGGFQGELKGFAAPELGAAAIRAAVERAQIKPEDLFTFDNKLMLHGVEVENGQHEIEIRRLAGQGPVYFNAYLTNFTLEDDIKKLKGESD